MTVIESILAVDVKNVPLIRDDSYVPQKERAALARKLFNELGIKNLSVKVPTGANCRWVDVRYPKLSCEATCNRKQSCSACHTNRKVEERLLEILLAAFPRLIDRSELQSDYFDPCWIISPKNETENSFSSSVEPMGVEPTTSALRTRRSPS